MNDWAVEDSEVARRILTQLGRAQSVSLEPGDYTRDKVAQIISEVRRKAKADGMMEAAMIAGHSKIITHNVVLNGETIPSTEWCRDPNAQEIYAAIMAAASKLETPTE